MKILEIASFFPPLGGAFCLDQARALRQAGHDVCILACNQYGITCSVGKYLQARWGIWRETLDGVEVYRCNTHGLPKLTRHNAEHWLSRVGDLYRRYVAEHGKPDVIHAHCCQWAGLAAWRIAYREGLPYFITEHLSAGLFEKEYGVGWIRHRWAQKMLVEAYRQARCVIPVAEELVSANARLFGCDYRWRWISNVIDTEFFQYRIRQHAEGTPWRICCLAVANIYLKGYDVLAKAWPMMQDCELFIAGRGTRGGDMQRQFEVCEAGQESTVHLLGDLSREAVRDLLYKCDLLVLPTRSEVQPLVLLEAMCTGIPVVTTDCVTRNVQFPGACYVARTGDAQSLAETMKEALAQGCLSEDVASQVRAMVSPHAVAERLASLFSET